MPMHFEDIYFSFFMLILLSLTVGAYFVRALLVGRARHARTDADGGSVLLNKASMEMGYWLLDPMVRGEHVMKEGCPKAGDRES